jgi:dUTP pyrophosphatase
MSNQKNRNNKQSPKDIDLGMIELNAVLPENCDEGASINFDETNDSVSAKKVVPIGIYKLHDTVKTPKYATPGSACFDLYADFTGIESIKVYSPHNTETSRFVQSFIESGNSKGVVIDSGERALIPTNIIFDIPEGWKMLIYARSGSALKQAAVLANGVGVVDSDYVEPSYVIIFNQSKHRLVIKQGDRIAQAEIVPVVQASFNLLSSAPSIKTNRAGGFGSTGK